ncbi:MAG: acetyl-CoA acetyltransferase [Frankiaceae bacterium]|nr:acetyl-CoA acetyltransferase [Frankiaceae bacterium]
MKPGSIAIVGAAETDEVGRLPGHSQIHLHVESARNAMRDAQVDVGDIDGIAGAGASIEVAWHLGIKPTYVDTTQVGGTSFLLHVRHAAAAITAGHAKTVLITHGESGRSRVGVAGRGPDPSGPGGQYEAPYGVFGPPSMFTVPVLRFLKERGMTTEHLAHVAVAQRKWSHQVPRAMMRDLITLDDVANSRMIAWPFHILECCLVTDGGGALIVTSADRAKDFPTNPVYLLGSGESMESPIVSQMEDFASSGAFSRASTSAWAESGLGPADIDHLMVYDAFAHLPLYGLEDLGFVGRGESGDFVAEGNTSPGGKLPMNTNGGGLSYTHSGMYGMYAIQESVRQLRGEAAAQVPNVKTSFVQGVGGMFMAGGSLILSNQQP